ncbi:MAG: hypothetical protein ABII88_02710 [Candidatus Omnitrophota bacterium]
MDAGIMGMLGVIVAMVGVILGTAINIGRSIQEINNRLIAIEKTIKENKK